jgi:FlaA1/EpsC-like NDP-sugar epimerase
MEDVAFDVASDAFEAVTSTRFANVAFSNGSLLQAFLIRIEKRQPLAVPIATRRFFVSHAEAADICLLSAFTAPDAHVLVPTLDPASHLTLLQEVAERVLRTQGYTPRFVGDETEARAAMAEVDATGRWPVLLTPLDTAGEKPYEEFVGEGEQLVDVGMRSLRGIAHRANPSLDALLEMLADLVDDPRRHVDKARLVELVCAAVPAMRHRETGASLDARM